MALDERINRLEAVCLKKTEDAQKGKLSQSVKQSLELSDHWPELKQSLKEQQVNEGKAVLRDQFLKSAWSEPDQAMVKPGADKKYSRPADDVLKTNLTPLQYQVTQQDGTEPPFRNEYWDNKKEGIYVDIVSGEPLFGSPDKFDSGTGWPSFTRPLEPENILEKKDRSLFMVRTEVRSKNADSHLGHVFPDGPPPTGLRYCMNSASMRFIPKDDLEKEGYGEYVKLFEEK